MNFIETYNPANTNLTDEDASAMKDLTSEQIEQLAKAYPNQPRGNAYLVYYNTNETLSQQRYPLGTWSNLHNLRLLGKKQILPFNFSKNHFVKPPTVPVVKFPQRTVDLSKEDISKAEGLKKVENPVIIPDQSNSQSQVIDNTVTSLEQKLAQAKADKAHPTIIKGIANEIKAAKKQQS